MRCLLLICCSVFACAATGNKAAARNSGFYSRHALLIWDRVAGSPKPIELAAPDGASSAIARYIESSGEGTVSIETKGRIGHLQVDLGPGVGSELLWAPDSSAFFVTTSDEGANGSYRTVVIGRFDGGLQVRDLTPLIVSSFGHPVKCDVPEEPNVGGITWIHGSERLLIAAEIANHSNCDSAGSFRAYEVDPKRMKVVRFFGQLQAKAAFRSELGVELINAEDSCVMHPPACYVTTLHADHPKR